MTAGATPLRASGAGHVLSVIELDVERLVEACRKILQRGITAVDVAVADDAHRDGRRRELAAVAISAGFVTGEARRHRVVPSFVTRIAGDGAVPLAGMKKLRIILCKVCVLSKRNHHKDTEDTKFA